MALINLSKKLKTFEEYKKGKDTHAWVTETHAASILRACKRYKFCVSIRDTGPDSIDRIKQGYPCKGHDILHKSLKESSIKKITLTPKRNDIDSIAKKKGCYGLVGHWVNPGTGGELGMPDGVLSTGGVNTTDGSPRALGGKLIKFSSIEQKAPDTVYTGDYDMHDLLYASRSSGAKIGLTVPSESVDEAKYINALNSLIWEDDDFRQKIVSKVTSSYKNLTESWKHSYALFRHGPQRNFMAFALDKKEAMIMALVKYDPPIAAFCHDGNCYILYTLTDIREWYAKYNAKEPKWWITPANDTWKIFGKSLLSLWLHRNNKYNHDHSTGKPFTKEKIKDAGDYLLAWIKVSESGKKLHKSKELYTGDLQGAVEEVAKNYMGVGSGMDLVKLGKLPGGEASKKALEMIKQNLKRLRKNKEGLLKV